jgi:putative serine protease PepD
MCYTYGAGLGDDMKKKARSLSRAVVFSALAILTGTVWVISTANLGQTYETSAVKLVIGDATCSGVHLGKGLILTAAHCVTASEKLEIPIEIKARSGVLTPSEVLWKNSINDIALLSSKALKSPSSSLDCSYTPHPGDSLRTVTSPLGMEFLEVDGTVVSYGINTPSSVEKGPLDDESTLWPQHYIINAALGPGSSGGPVYDPSGQIIGVVVGSTQRQPSLIVAIPSSVVCHLLAKA